MAWLVVNGIGSFFIIAGSSTIGYPQAGLAIALFCLVGDYLIKQFRGSI